MSVQGRVAISTRSKHARPGAPFLGDEGITHRVGSLTGRTVSAVSVMRPSLAVATIVALLGLSWGSIYLIGGAGHAPPHLFYLPIIVAATRFGVRGAFVTALASGVVAGPMLPSDVALGVAQVPSDEIVRAVCFVVIGTLMGAIIWRLKESLAQEAELAAQEAELVRQKAALISTVSHEFRTPLSVLLGSSKMLLQQAEWPELERTLLEGISGSAGRLNDLVAAILAVAEGPLREERVIAREVRLDRVLSSVVTSRSPREAERLRIDVGSATVWSDGALLEALLRQLVDNALRFSPDSSHVEVTVRPSAPGRVEVVVADRGPGIDERFLPKAFDAFTQQDNSVTRDTGGLGIGLFVAQRLAEHLHCELTLEPRPGGGTEATVSISEIGFLP